ncbi:MAG: hypothetical protein AVDCRST_MAG33-580, partial [uncultured Thermomicrobiales bacterium]
AGPPGGAISAEMAGTAASGRGRGAVTGCHAVPAYRPHVPTPGGAPRRRRRRETAAVV